MSWRSIAVGVVCTVPMAACAEPVMLNGPALTVAMTGATVEVDTPFRLRLPVQYSADGKITAEAGGLSGYLGSASDHGKWWVETDRLCHKWSRWFDRETQCLRIIRDGANLQWSRDDGQKGTATIVAEAPRVEKPPFALGAPDLAPRAVAAAPVIVAPEVPASPPVAVPPPAAKPSPVAVKTTPAPNAPAVIAAVASPAPAKSAARPPALAKPVAAVPAPLTEPAAPSYKVAGVRPDDVLNVRRQPSEGARVVGALPAEARGLHLAGACVKEWCPIVHRGLSGWVGRYYLEAENAAGKQIR